MVTEEQRRSSCVGAVRPHLFMTPGATGTVFMACSFPCLPSPHNEPHYSAPLASTIAVLFWHRTHQHHRWWWWWWRDQRWAKEKTKSKVFLEFQGKTFGFCFIQILFFFSIRNYLEKCSCGLAYIYLLFRNIKQLYSVSVSVLEVCSEALSSPGAGI